MNHATTRAATLPEIVKMIQKQYGIGEDSALRMFYESSTGASFTDNETGLYGRSPNFIFGLFLEEQNAREKL